MHGAAPFGAQGYGLRPEGLQLHIAFGTPAGVQFLDFRMHGAGVVSPGRLRYQVNAVYRAHPGAIVHVIRMIGADPPGSHRFQGKAASGAVAGLRLAYSGVGGAIKVFGGNIDKLLRIFLKLNQAVPAAKVIFPPLIKGMEWSFGVHLHKANRV